MQFFCVFAATNICSDLILSTGSGTSGLAQLDAKQSGRMGSIAVGYYLLTTVIAVIVGHKAENSEPISAKEKVVLDGRTGFTP